MEKRLLMFLAGLFLCVGGVLAQNQIKGTVVSSSDGEPVVGASVLEVGTKNGAVTDVDGKFVLTAKPGAKLKVQYIGMETQTVTARNNMLVELQLDAKSLDEVVVTGYGNFKKSSFTGSAATMSTDKLNDVPTMSVEDKLAGNVSGVSITASSGQPGAVTSIRVRGMGSINAGNNPLFVIDGTPVNNDDLDAFSGYYNSAGMNPLTTLNSNDIESITVIKDAAAASLYGSRAANGVIVITTKSGGAGKTKVDFRADWGFSNMAINYRPTLDGDARRELIYEGLKNYAIDNNGADATAAAEFADARIDRYAAKPENGWTDWRDLLIKNGSHQNYQASVQGGNEKTKFYAGLSYGKQNGITAASSLERMTGNANVSHTFGKFQMDVTSLFSTMTQYVSDDYGMSYTAPLACVSWFTGPTHTAYNEDGSYADYTGSPYNYGANPLYENEHSYDKNKTRRAFNTIALQWNIWDALKLRSKLAYDYTNTTTDVLWDSSSLNGSDSGGVLQRNIAEVSTLTTQTQLTYVKSFGKHNVDALVGFETEDWHENYLYTYGQGYLGSLYELGNAEDTASETYKYDSKMTSVLGRVNYNYSDLYYLGASFRTDGSSRLARANRWGNFWSVSGAWRFGGEKFMLPLRDVLSDAKLRVSYGVNGTLPSGLYSYMNLYKYGNYYNGSIGMAISGVGNSDIRWEKNKALNFGLDLTFIDRINVTLDYYVRNTSDLIMDKPISYVPGYVDSSYTATVAQNVGSLRNTGIELSVKSTNIQTKDFYWTTTLNVGHNSNKITKLTGEGDEIISSIYNHKVGKSYYSFYMYEYAGVDPATGLESYYINDGTENARKTTTKVAEANKVIVGKHEADIEGGLSNFMKWKFIDFNFTLTYKLGGDSFDAVSYLHDNGGAYALRGAIPAYYDLSKMWKKEGDVAQLPKFQVGYGKAVTSSRWLMPNDYLRVKNISVGFSAPDKWISPVGISKARLYFSANNLLTWKSSGMYVDPETPVDGYCLFEMPALRTYTFGIEIGF